ncbi:hypothetical protein [Cetobacterium sp.]|uniref:hypothetical protein n=1 Tax=Cetobacterium sp. TaxID=2071632 RepID=UPI003EE4EB53
MERYIELYEKIEKMDKDFKIDKIEKIKLNRNGKPVAETEKIAIYKRDNIENVCFCIELKEDKLIIMYPYHSVASFVKGLNPPRIYKKLGINNWKKAVEIIQGFESREIEWIKELTY